jgi:hypothetical protein
VKLNQPEPINAGLKSAAGQYLGYSLQTTRFLAKLLDSGSEQTVSLEIFEDVGIESPDGHKVAEQDKSTQSNNPVSDRAVELWKTFNNWIDAVSSGQLAPDKTVFELYVSCPNSGEIVQSFADAKSSADAKKAFDFAKQKLWGPAPAFPLRPNVSQAIAPYITKFFEANESIIYQIIQNFSLTCGSGSPHSDLRALLGKALVPQEIIDDALNYALGWVKAQTDIFLEKGQSARISVAEFRAVMESFLCRHDRKTILVTFAGAPTKDEIETHLRIRTYIRQLEIIDAEDGDRLKAVSDFLRAAVDRTKWSQKGWVNATSFEEFEDSLIRTWENFKKKTNIALITRSPTEQGRYLYAECSSHQARLQGLDVPPHFVPGSFHALADTLSIGWHPDYKIQLKTNTSEVRGCRHEVADIK